jgi:hypothetical protein
MKTINSKIEIFDTLAQAQKSFAKVESGQLLKSIYGKYLVDRSFEAKKQWPGQYLVLRTKGGDAI